MRRAILSVMAAGLAAAGGPAAAQDDPVRGPGKICLKYSSFDLLEGEAVEGFGGGVETIRLTLESLGGAIQVLESEIFAPREPMGTPVADEGGTRVYRRQMRDEWTYLITGPTNFDRSGNRLVLVLSGPGFTGSQRDAAIYGRFRVADPGPFQCLQRFLYGWEFMIDSTESR